MDIEKRKTAVNNILWSNQKEKSSNNLRKTFIKDQTTTHTKKYEMD